jgi:hypothetical protein
MSSIKDSFLLYNLALFEELSNTFYLIISSNNYLLNEIQILTLSYFSHLGPPSFLHSS